MDSARTGPVSHSFLNSSQTLLTPLKTLSKPTSAYNGLPKGLRQVPHNRLLLKLKYYSIRNNTLDWIKNLLNNRQQNVAVDGESSAPTPVLLGVPQGSVIGPTLFLIYVNYLPNGIKSKVRLFADDTIMYLTINNSDNCQQLQMT